MALFPRIFMSPIPLDRADNGLPALVNVDMFDGHLLLPFASVAIEGLHLGCEGSGKLV